MSTATASRASSGPPGPKRPEGPNEPNGPEGTGNSPTGSPRRRSVFSTFTLVVAELLITAGIIVLLFLAWKLWWTNIEAESTQRSAVAEMAQEFAAQQGQGGAGADGSDAAASGTPPEMEQPGNAEYIGIVYIPRFGEQWSRPVVQGVGLDVLDTLGLGHYPETVMPGGVGNFSVAGHRQTHGQVLDAIDQLQNGDNIYVWTKNGYLTYTVRSHQIVTPDQTDVIAPVPGKPGAKPTERLMTLTTCHPRYGDTERYIVHAALTEWRGNAQGPPAAIAEQVKEAGG